MNKFMLNLHTTIDQLETFADHPSAFLATNEETQIFTSEKVPGLIAYQKSGRRYIVMVAGISSRGENKSILLADFVRWAKSQQRYVIAIQMLRDDAIELAKQGFTVNQVGSSFCLELKNFSLAGKRFMKLRNKISQARRSGVKILEFGKDIAFTSDIASQIRQIDDMWLKSKGNHSYAFLIGEVGDLRRFDCSVKRLFLAVYESRIIAYILYTPSYGNYQGWMHDLTRRLPTAPAGIMELLNISAIDAFRSECVSHLNFGFTPFANLNPELELPGHSLLASKILTFMGSRNLLYPVHTQTQYKLKWEPRIVLPEYIAFHPGFSLMGLWNVLRLTKAV